MELTKEVPIKELGEAELERSVTLLVGHHEEHRACES